MPETSHLAIAIVGRPNVGKSTLFNRLVGKRLALVDDTPGVTRDRREGEARLGDLEFRVFDTAGLEEADALSLPGRMRAQTEIAIAEADAVMFLVDARAGILPDDRAFAAIVRRSGKPVVLVANKAEGPKGVTAAYEAFSLGLGDPVAFSAEHAEGLADLRDALAAALPALLTPTPEEDADGDGAEERDPNIPLRICVVGRPNAGKSTLVNTLIGEERLLTGPEAGITRDAISVDWIWHDRRVRLFDTAGMRRKARVQDKLEKLSVVDALRAIRFAESVVLLLDATIPFERQDLTLADLVEREGRAIVIAINKWDLVADAPGRLKELRENAEHFLPQIKGCAVVPVSGLTGAGLDRLMQAVFRADEIWSRRAPTAKLNRWLEGIVANHPPPAVSGRRIKLRYVTQAKARPPHFAIFGNQLAKLPMGYQRYLVNSLRETFDLPGTPIRLSLKSAENPFDPK